MPGSLHCEHGKQSNHVSLYSFLLTEDGVKNDVQTTDTPTIILVLIVLMKIIAFQSNKFVICIMR